MNTLIKLNKFVFFITAMIFFLLIQGTHASTILIDDNFNSENGGIAPNTIYYNFQNWVLTSGSVDLCGPVYYSYHHMPSWVGLYVDLDGGTSSGGIMVSKTDFVLNPGLYELKFDLSGSVYGEANLVNVSLGSVYSQDFIIEASDPFTTFVRYIDIPVLTSGNLVFDHSTGHDWVGPLLDNVKLTKIDSVPEPATMLLLASALSGLIGLRRKFQR